MDNRQQAKQQAEEYIGKRDYKMTVISDDGDVTRCLHFAHENRGDGHFVITTWPGCLAISGDMGSYMFTRINDMVNFFSGDNINYSYWEEKCSSSSENGGIKKFDTDLFKKEMIAIKAQLTVDLIDEYGVDLDDLNEDEKEKFEDAKSDINDAFLMLEDVEDEHSAIAFARDLDTDDLGLDSCDLPHPESYTFRYLFACNAINFACNTYLKQNMENSPQQSSGPR